MKNLFFLIVSAFILSSCATPTEETAPSEETTVDSTVVESADTTSVDSTVAAQ
jgi:PBP1b-binding outer membrane lipoprotein LpoB